MTGAPSNLEPPLRWHLVVPVKETSLGKTRLVPPAPLSRTDVALAVAADALEQVCRALPPEQVTVVTSDVEVARVARGLGARVLADPGAGLNAAVHAGWGTSPAADGPPPSRPDRPGAHGWAALLGDLPCLLADDLRTALARCAAFPRAVVPDAEGTGTVLLTSTEGPPEPRFGPGSAARHAVDAELLALDLPRLRRDVDTAADLEEALSLGVGPRTAAALGPRVW